MIGDEKLEPSRRSMEFDPSCTSGSTRGVITSLSGQDVLDTRESGLREYSCKWRYIRWLHRWNPFL